MIAFKVSASSDSLETKDGGISSIQIVSDSVIVISTGFFRSSSVKATTGSGFVFTSAEENNFVVAYSLFDFLKFSFSSSLFHSISFFWSFTLLLLLLLPSSFPLPPSFVEKLRRKNVIISSHKNSVHLSPVHKVCWMFPWSPMSSLISDLVSPVCTVLLI